MTLAELLAAATRPQTLPPGWPDMSRRTRMPDIPLPFSNRRDTPQTAPPDFDPAAPRGGHRTRMPPNVPSAIPDPTEFLRQILGQGSLSDWKPGPTTPFGGLDAYGWKDPARPPEYIGNIPQGPTAEDLQYLKLFGDQMWQSPGRSAGSIVGNKSNRP